MKRYPTIIFDVGGTLLQLNVDKLAHTYVQLAARRGISLDHALTRAVLVELEGELPSRSRERQISLEKSSGQGFWEEFYGEGFRRLGVQADMSAEAAEIRERFQRAEFEMLFPDVLPALQGLEDAGIQMGILSNFSPNCEDVLKLMRVHHFYSFFVVSALAGMEKPDPRIFELAVRAAQRPRADILYVGDSIFHDIEGANRAGLDAVLVDRRERFTDFPGMRITNLTELVAWSGKEHDAHAA